MIRNHINIKYVAVVIVCIVAIALVGLGAYSILSRIMPEKAAQSSETNNTKDRAAAEKTYREASDADRTQNYSKAISDYNKILPFYKEAAKSSVTDQNTAWQIETRIASIEKNSADLQKTLDDQAKQNPNIKLIPEGEGKKPDFEITY